MPRPPQEAERGQGGCECRELNSKGDFHHFGEKWLREGQEQNNRVRRLRGVSVAARRASKAMAADGRAVF